MQPVYEYGTPVRVVRNIRNDGSFPGKDRGNLLVRRGSIGYVKGMGRFLQDQLIYEVHFPDADCHVGVRDTELIEADAPWVESRFEFREWVITERDLAVNGEIRVARGARGQVLKVLRETDPARYEVCFTDKVYELSEAALSPAPALESEDVA